MKQLQNINRYTLIVIFLLIFSKIQVIAQTDNEASDMSNVEISLLTCAPHDEIYSLYGHTAIRIHDKTEKTDLVANYGVFSFQKPYFVLRFVLGLTDYEMGVVSFSDFSDEYLYYGAEVTEQVLNLTNEEKRRILTALQTNYRPENRVYRYNYFYNNCTTKARDIISDNLDGRIVYRNNIPTDVSYRSIVGECANKHPWARFGNDMLLGVRADLKTTREEQQFLPANLMRDFDSAEIRGNDGRIRNLVKTTRVILHSGPYLGQSTSYNIPSPTVIAWFVLAFIIGICALEYFSRKKFIAIDAIWFTLSGLAGILLFVMIFSQHPTTSINFQILLMNPANLFIAYYIIRYRRNPDKQQKVWKAVTIITLLFGVFRLLQVYAEGIPLLALSLLIRLTWNIVHKQTNEQ